MTTDLSLISSLITSGEPVATRKLSDLAELFAEPIEGGGEQVVYEIYGSPNQDDLDPPALLAATTVLYPGSVAGEPFMTRGHYHLRPDRGEICLIIEGEGKLLLAEKTGSTSVVELRPGAVVSIDATQAHRVVNTGKAPLVFFVTWMSDCGHEYPPADQSPFPRVQIEPSVK